MTLSDMYVQASRSSILCPINDESVSLGSPASGVAVIRRGSPLFSPGALLDTCSGFLVITLVGSEKNVR